jgi:UDP-N-acetylglucosamine 2-epimerase
MNHIKLYDALKNITEDPQWKDLEKQSEKYLLISLHQISYLRDERLKEEIKDINERLTEILNKIK